MLVITVRDISATDSLDEDYDICVYESDSVPRVGERLNHCPVDGEIESLLVEKVERDLVERRTGGYKATNVTVFVSYPPEDERPI